MKNNSFAKWMAAAAIALCSVACNDSDDRSAPTDIAGTYGGYTLSSCSYFTDTCAGDETVLITNNADGTAAIAFTSSALGKFSIGSATVAARNGVCEIVGSGTAQMGMQSVQTYDCTVSGSIRSLDDAEIRFSVPSVMGGMHIVFKTGAAPAELLLPGTYGGYSAASFAYSAEPMYTDDESLTIAAEDGALSLSFASAQWGTFQTPLTVAYEDKVYTLEGAGSVAMGMGASTNSYQYTLTGKVDAAKNEYEFSFSVPAVMGGLTVVLHPGKAPATAE
ncbi:MAG: hypothetical protein K2L04_00885 [Alistipes sp.]|nr:hypothetical protein [Alistipes sp.]